MPRTATKVDTGISFEDEDEDPDDEEEQPCCEACDIGFDEDELKNGLCVDCRCSNCDEVGCDCWECNGCDTKYNFGSGDRCDNCEYCGSCCECEECNNCGAKYGAYSSLFCHDCENCCDCCSCESEDSDGGDFGQSSAAPWVARGISVTYSDLRVEAAIGYTEDWNQFWKIQNDYIDPAKSMCDFYLLDGVAGMVFNGFHGIARDQMCTEIAARAKQMKEDLVANILPSFRNYADMAIGGELRYHKAVGKHVLDKGARHMAWIDWYLFRQKAGVQAVAEAAQLFREIKHGGIGGEAWAVASDILYGHLSGKLDAHTFCDRIFTLQHNGGSFLNKISWLRANRPNWSLGEMSAIIGPCHSNNPTVYSVLLAACSNEVAAVFSEWWRASNAARRAVGVPMTPKPSFRDHLKVQGSRGKPYYELRLEGQDFDFTAGWNTRLFDNEWVATFPAPPMVLPDWWLPYHTAFLCMTAWAAYNNNARWRPGEADPFTSLDELKGMGHIPAKPNDNVYDFYIGSGTLRWMRTAYEQLMRDGATLPVASEMDMERVGVLLYHQWTLPVFWPYAEGFYKRHGVPEGDRALSPKALGLTDSYKIFTPWAEWLKLPKPDPWTTAQYPPPLLAEKMTVPSLKVQKQLYDYIAKHPKPHKYWTTSSFNSAPVTYDEMVVPLVTAEKAKAEVEWIDIAESDALVPINDVAPSDSEEFEF